MRALPLIILLLIFSALGYVYRDTIHGWFTGATPSAQTVVLRQIATPSPTVVAVISPTIQPVPVVVSPSSTAVPVGTHLPTTGPVENIFVVGLIAAVALSVWRWIFRPAMPTKRPLDIF